MKIITKNQKETIELGEKIARGLRGGEILALEGNLGAGKTTLIKGIARGLGIKKSITSPTFVLMKVYKSTDTHGFLTDRRRYKIKNLVHVDAYRLKDEKGLIEIGIGDYLGEKDSVAVIEWAERVKKIFKGKKIIKIKLGLGKKEDERKIILKK